MADLRICENMARMMLKLDIGDKNPLEDDIRQAVTKISHLMVMGEGEKEKIEKQLQASFKVRMDLGDAVVNPVTYHPWLENRKSHIDPYYWERYKTYLSIEQGWTDKIIDKLGEVSDKLLNLCGNPNENGIWKRKGLVLGDIQSGKTSNYLALCNKAADAGYKVIILLTGTLEGLRKQTQERVDSGFVGLNSRNVLQKNPEKKYIGVGSLDSNRTAYPFTSVLTDFNSAKLQSLNFTIKGLPEPVILVIKKNKKVLENLTTWLSTRNTDTLGEKIDLPLLLIDDEADNASVNTNKPDKSPTTINNSIVELLRLFNKSSYVAVTATPYANIFIDPDLDKGPDEFNLFPSDFIYALSAPTNYIGANDIFGNEAEYKNCLELIDDVIIDIGNSEYIFRSKAKSSHKVPRIPESLKQAFCYFLLINAVRDIKEEKTSHRSMIVNVSQFVAVQDQVYDILKDLLKEYKTKIQSYSRLDERKALEIKEIKSLYELWNKFDMSSSTELTWKQVQANLYEATMPIEVILVNQKAKEKGIKKLDYEPYKQTGLRVIAVGGNSLSRGLTLEGLCVSYFDRNSQMYDTLMQMGRWFGYRIGYEKFFKIWMEPNAISWYQYITQATAELREDIFEMRRVGLTPKEFGLKIQQDQTSLFVTARNKMRATATVEQWISVAAELIETPRLIANKKNLEINMNTTIKLIQKLAANKEEYWDTKLNIDDNRMIYSNINKDIIAQYIGSFISHPKHIPFSSKDLSEYIQVSNRFNKWSVAIIGGGGNYLATDFFPQEIASMNIRYSKRVIRRTDNCILISGKRARVGVPGATKYGLEKEVIENITKKFETENKSKTVPDKPYLRIDRQPILLIYIVNIDTESKDGRKINSDRESIELIGDMPVVCLGLGFPGSDVTKSEKVKYVINRISEREMLDFEEDDEEDEYD